MRRSLLLVLLVLGSLLGTGCGDGGSQPPVQEPAPSSARAEGPEPAPVPPKVDLRDVAYGCGPTDATGIRFQAASSEPTVIRAELVVDGTTYGTTDDIEVGNTSISGWIDISLTTEAYEHGEGEVRAVHAEDGELLASAPVALRLPEGGGCG